MSYVCRQHQVKCNPFFPNGMTSRVHFLRFYLWVSTEWVQQWAGLLRINIRLTISASDIWISSMGGYVSFFLMGSAPWRRTKVWTAVSLSDRSRYAHDIYNHIHVHICILRWYMHIMSSSVYGLANVCPVVLSRTSSCQRWQYDVEHLHVLEGAQQAVSHSGCLEDIYYLSSMFGCAPYTMLTLKMI